MEYPKLTRLVLSDLPKVENLIKTLVRTYKIKEIVIEEEEVKYIIY